MGLKLWIQKLGTMNASLIDTLEEVALLFLADKIRNNLNAGEAELVNQLASRLGVVFHHSGTPSPTLQPSHESAEKGNAVQAGCS